MVTNNDAADIPIATFGPIIDELTFVLLGST